VDAVLVTTASLLLLAAAWSMLLAVRRRWPAGWLSDPLPRTQTCFASNETEDDDYGEGEGGAGVREPRRPLPSSGGAAAYVDPDERVA
jgi:hypothetical protein